MQKKEWGGGDKLLAATPDEKCVQTCDAPAF